MTQTQAAIFKSPTKSPQPASSRAVRPAARAKVGGPVRSRILASGTGRAATRGGGGVIELADGTTVYPAHEEGGRWRAVWHEDGEPQQCEAVSEEKLAARVEKLTERLAADAPNMTRPGADLIAHSLDPDRLPVHGQAGCLASLGIAELRFHALGRAACCLVSAVDRSCGRARGGRRRVQVQGVAIGHQGRYGA
jgi:hypothetical protein